MTDELAARREARDGTDNLTCGCGSQWWATPGLCIAAKGAAVTGYAKPLTCLQCGAIEPEDGRASS